MNPVSASQFCYVYVLRSIKSGHRYVGLTVDLRKRLREHTHDQSTYTKGRGPYELIYYEAYKNKTDARAREIQLKSGQGKRYLKERLKRFLALTG